MSSSNPFEGVQSQGPAQNSGQVTGVGSGVTTNAILPGQVIPPVLQSDTAIGISGTTEIELGKVTIPRGTCVAGTTFEIVAEGYATQPATACQVSSIVRMGPVGGGNAGAQVSAVTRATPATALSAAPFAIRGTFTVGVRNTDYSLLGQGVADGPLFQGGAFISAAIPGGPINLNIDNELRLSIQLAAATINTLHLTNFVVNMINR